MICMEMAEPDEIEAGKFCAGFTESQEGATASIDHYS